MRNKSVKIKLVIIKLVKIKLVKLIIFIQIYKKKNNCDICMFYRYIILKYNIDSYY